jgi:hypothetical protein
MNVKNGTEAHAIPIKGTHKWALLQCVGQAKVFRHTVQNCTFSPIYIYVLNVFNVGHPAEA